MSEPPASLTVPAQEIHMRDSVAEGTIVASLSIANRERYNPFTGEVSHPRMVEVTSFPAKVVAVDTLPDGRHLHGPDNSSMDVRAFEWGELVRVIRPAPIEPCECGFPQERPDG